MSPCRCSLRGNHGFEELCAGWVEICRKMWQFRSQQLTACPGKLKGKVLKFLIGCLDVMMKGQAPRLYSEETLASLSLIPGRLLAILLAYMETALIITWLCLAIVCVHVNFFRAVRGVFCGNT